jgi:hypothetical protein
MANDRIWIVCKQCSEKKLLAKYYPTLSSDWPPGSDFSSWMYDHMHHGNNGMNLAGDSGFELKTDDQV